MNTILIAAALIALPAAAQAAVDTKPADGGAAAKPAVAADKNSYCMFQEVTSSRLPRKVCKSRAEWTALGVEITRTR